MWVLNCVKNYSYQCCCCSTLRLGQEGRHFTDNILKCIFLNEMYEFPLKFHWGLFLRVQLTILQRIMSWSRPGDKPLSESLIGRLVTHICVTRPQWVNVKTGKSQALLVNHCAKLTAQLLFLSTDDNSPNILVDEWIQKRVLPIHTC